MELLIAILFALGFNYTPEQVTASQATGQDATVKHAEQIASEHLYYYSEEDGGIIIDGVDPANNEIH